MFISAIKTKLIYFLPNLVIQLYRSFWLRKYETTVLYAIRTVPARFQQQQVQQESDETIRYPVSPSRTLILYSALDCESPNNCDLTVTCDSSFYQTIRIQIGKLVFWALSLWWIMCRLCWGSTASAKLSASELLGKLKVRPSDDNCVVR